MRAAVQGISQRPLSRSPVPARGRVGTVTGPARSVSVVAAAEPNDGFEIPERRLRYPGGGERVLRYAGNYCARNSGPRIDSESWRVYSAASAPASSDQDATSASSSFPNSPAALVRMLNSESFRNTLEAREETIRKSYTVHRTSPYVEKAVLFVMAAYHEDRPADMFTMKTKVLRMGAAEELGLPPGLVVQEITEGVVAFESEDDADRYALLLEAEGHQNIMIADTPADALFELTTSCSAVVVLFKAGSQAPMPLDLAQALKGAVSLE